MLCLPLLGRLSHVHLALAAWLYVNQAVLVFVSGSTSGTHRDPGTQNREHTLASVCLVARYMDSDGPGPLG